MKGSVDRKFARFFYYVDNVARDLAPQFLFRRQLDRILSGASRHDAATLAERVNYYNKLSGPVREEVFASTVASIPMTKSMYYYDLKEHARFFPRHLRLNHCFGDVRFVPDRPSFVKSRPIAGDNRNSILLKLNRFRHFYFLADRTPFLAKKPMAVWRGHTNERRALLLGRYSDHPLCDVGVTHGRHGVGHRKPWLHPREQLRFRYVISIEGNDVASNLKWIMASNSLCMQPKPEIETWFMEGRLQAGKHYVELRDDFADLEDKILYYERHTDEALEIIRYANAHVAQFLDKEREQLLSLLVLCKYFVLTGQIAVDPAWADLIMPPADGPLVTRPVAQMSSAPDR